MPVEAPVMRKTESAMRSFRSGGRSRPRGRRAGSPDCLWNDGCFPMLYDKARIFVQAGGGGDGCMSFRREAHVPRGGPAGGGGGPGGVPDGVDGGRGGDVVLVCDDSMRDLQSFKRRAHYKAPRGRHGEGSQRHGADGEDLVVRVPPGTVATLEDGTVHDLLVPGQRATVAAGGSGGGGGGGG